MTRSGLIVSIIDGGGRGHALYEAVRSSPQVGRVIVLPGNAGIYQEDCEDRLPLSDMRNVHEIILAAKSIGADIIVAGSEVSLVAGLGGACKADGIRMVGPSGRASMLEGSKIFAKKVMHAAKIEYLTGNYYTAHDYATAVSLIRTASVAWDVIPVIKADGLCAGKGVTVAKTLEEADAAAHAALVEKIHGAAGDTILIEEPFEGEEVSLFYLCDGENAVPLSTARDYKRLSADADAPNTGGMGAYAPVPGTNELLLEVRDQVVLPVMREMEESGMPYHGILYVGIMLTKKGPRVIEFNCRFGDPEAQVILPLFDGDIVPYLLATTELGGLAKLPPPRFKQGFAICVVLADENYGKPGAKIEPRSVILPEKVGPNQRLFHAGTKFREGSGLESSGGRVFNAVGLGDTVAEAREQAYALVAEIRGPLYYRKDIALGI